MTTKRASAMRRPRTSTKMGRQRLSPLVAYWSLKLLVQLGFWKQLTGYPDALTFDGTMLSTLGLRRYEDQEMSPTAFLRLLKDRLQALTAKQPEAILEPMHSRLQEELTLSLVECRILTFALVLCSHRPFKAIAEECGEFSRTDVISVLATTLDLNRTLVRKALIPDGHLARSGLLRVTQGGAEALEDRFLLLEGLDDLLFDTRSNVASLTRSYFSVAPRPTLTRRDYPHLHTSVVDLLAYLKAARERREPGCNVLLYGTPGTGKTELAGVVARALKLTLHAISSSDEDGEAMSDARRIGGFQLAQHTHSRQPNSLILFDEAESLLAPSWVDRLFEPDSLTVNKAFINQLLEANPIPTLWISNSIEDMDPAYLRRFDMVIHIPVPPRAVRASIASKSLSDLGVSAGFIQGLARNPNLAPAHLTRAARVAKLAGVKNASQTQTEDCLTRVLSGTLRALGHAQALVTNPSEVTAYRPDLLNPDRPIEPLIEGLKQLGQGRLCLYGPPGTGKSAFGAHIADALERPLLLKRASDLLGPFVGETEQAIAAMFTEAHEEDAVLVLDEADSFLRSRASAHQSWEVTQVNELLTQIEAFSGVFICTTNLIDQLDEASLRRFDMKLRFDPLRPEQRWSLFDQVLREQGVAKTPRQPWLTSLAGLDGLTPGDFAAVIRHFRIERAVWTPALLFERLQAECVHKRRSGSRPIGFAAAL